MLKLSRRLLGASSLLGAALALACSNSAKSDAGTSPGTAGTSSWGGASASAGGEGSAISGAGGRAGSATSGGATAANGGSSERGGGAGASAASNAGSGTSSAGSAGAVWSSSFPTFTKHTIASFSAGYAVAVVDIDGDGLKDVVALSSGAAGLVWFKNPAWTKYGISTATKQIFLAPHDVDGDGDVDLALVSDFDMNNTTSGGTISWAEAPSDPTKTQDWPLHTINAIPTAHRLRWADIDGDGKKELIALPLFGTGSSGQAHAGAVRLTAYVSPQDPKTAWTSKLLDDTHLEVAHGLEVVDWDGDQAEDLLTAANDGVDLFRPSRGSAAEHLGAGKAGQAPTKGSSEVALGSLGGARFIAAIEPWHGTDAVIYTAGASATDLWTRQVLGSAFEHGHGLAVGDFNGDGFDEVVGGGGQGMRAQFIFRYLPSSGAWDQLELDVGGVAVSGLDVKDLDGDGALDIVAIGGSPTNNVVWYENSR